ncbi:jg14344 [Pararge aegeria aegeria]|uniref:Jg14344 protein n=1 Tax=Pararge aegeria aegeria TaxID=348720 RepID=A0A8S4R6G5_9NEOP|nr:jg14344 [Pararge aegeria aegeria]
MDPADVPTDGKLNTIVNKHMQGTSPKTCGLGVKPHVSESTQEHEINEAVSCVKQLLNIRFFFYKLMNHVNDYILEAHEDNFYPGKHSRT